MGDTIAVGRHRVLVGAGADDLRGLHARALLHPAFARDRNRTETLHCFRELRAGPSLAHARYRGATLAA